MDGAERLEPLAIRERKVEQNNIHRLGGGHENLERLLQRFGNLHREFIRRPIIQRLPNEAGIAGVIFNEQDAGSLSCQIIYWAGSFTISTQNSSIDLTTCIK